MLKSSCRREVSPDRPARFSALGGLAVPAAGRRPQRFLSLAVAAGGAGKSGERERFTHSWDRGLVSGAPWLLRLPPDPPGTGGCRSSGRPSPRRPAHAALRAEGQDPQSGPALPQRQHRSSWCGKEPAPAGLSVPGPQPLLDGQHHLYPHHSRLALSSGVDRSVRPSCDWLDAWLDHRTDTALLVKALNQARCQRHLEPEQLLNNMDQGSQYRQATIAHFSARTRSAAACPPRAVVGITPWCKAFSPRSNRN